MCAPRWSGYNTNIDIYTKEVHEGEVALLVSKDFQALLHVANIWDENVWDKSHSQAVPASSF